MGIRKYMERNRKRKNIIKKRVWEYLKLHPCVDCGESDIRVLDFDHVRGHKRANVQRLVNSYYCWKTVEIEIQKCDVICANCHRRKTANEQNWYHCL